MDIELVIKINEDIYKQIKGVCGYTIMGGGRGSGRTAFLSIPMNAIRNGIPLPKGHGKIGDIDKLYQVFERNVAGAKALKDLFDNADTIIEADKGDKE